MTDPMSSGATQVVEEAINELQTALNQQDQLANKEPPSVQFNEVMQSKEVQPLDGTPSASDPASVIRAARQAQAGPGARPGVPAVGQALDTTPLVKGMRRIVEDILQGQNKLGEIISLALTGRNFSTPELLALQAGVYRFSQELEMMSKVIEKATTTIKQTMNTQV